MFRLCIMLHLVKMQEGPRGQHALSWLAYVQAVHALGWLAHVQAVHAASHHLNVSILKALSCFASKYRELSHSLPGSTRSVSHKQCIFYYKIRTFREKRPLFPREKHRFHTVCPTLGFWHKLIITLTPKVSTQGLECSVECLLMSPLTKQ